MSLTPQNDDRAHAMRRIQVVGALIALGALAVLAAIYAAGNHAASKRAAGGHYRFAVGSPGRGQRAPGFTLASSSGGSFSLGAQRGKSVLLYFQEGLTCEPCWTQLKDLERNTSQLRSLGVQQLVSITTDPANQIHQKVQDEGIRSPVLADPGLTASRAYEANKYGMMGDSRDGHSFVLVGPNGTIKWRADYGGPPDFTMYVPPAALLADLRRGINGGV